ncbi:MAG: ABC transporter permease [Armatimonadota bacterium]|nr:ABC transporter permease [Armatimonadota bacterium]
MNTIWLIANGTFGEAIRRRTLLIFLLVAAVIIIAGAANTSLRPHHDTLVIETVGQGVILLTGVFISVILGINLLPIEIERRTVYTILSKPVHRYQFLCGKFLGGLMTVLTSVAVMSFVFLLFFVIKERGFDTEVLKVCKGLLLIVFAIILINAIAMFFSVFISPFVNFFLTFAIYLLGLSSSVTEALADPNSDPGHPKNPIVVMIFKVIHAVIPNFANYNVQNPILDPRLRITNETFFLSSSILYALAYSAFLLLIAALVFDRREV